MRTRCTTARSLPASAITCCRRAWHGTSSSKKIFAARLTGIERFDGDGIIADFDDPAVGEALRDCPLPVVAWVRRSKIRRTIPPDLPYIATDNSKLVSLGVYASDRRGPQHFALYSLPQAQENRWAQQRELAFAHLRRADGRSGEQIEARFIAGCRPARRHGTRRPSSSPRGCRAIAEAGRHHRRDRCARAASAAGVSHRGHPVPEEVAIIGIDNDPLTRTLTRIPLSSVIQGTEEMGRTAAHCFASDAARRAFSGAAHSRAAGRDQRAGIDAASTAGEPLCDARAALHPPVRMPGHQTEQVADYVGVSRSSLEEYFRRERSAPCIRKSCAISSMSRRRCWPSAMRRARKWRFVAASRHCNTCMRFSAGNSAVRRASIRRAANPATTRLNMPFPSHFHRRHDQHRTTFFRAVGHAAWRRSRPALSRCATRMA